MKKTFLILGLATILGCTSQKSSSSSSKTASGDTRTTAVVSLDDNTYLVTETTDDKSYGFEQSNPVKVGGVGGGPKNERRFLNGLLGPNGEELGYFRTGSCCPFKTPNGLFENSGMLDRYRVYWTGCKDTLNIYINMYDKGDLKIPVGLTGKKSFQENKL